MNKIKMLNRLYSFFYYLQYLVRSFHLHGIHSPFVFDLQKNVFSETLPYYSFEKIEAIRAKLLLTDKDIEILDLGAGSNKKAGQTRSIKSITSSAVKPAHLAQILHRLANKNKANTILELGTSVGLTTAYLATANPSSEVLSFEGSPKLVELANINLKKLEINNVKVIEGHFDNTLPFHLREIDQIDFAFIDGNHQKEATINYFEWISAAVHENSILVFDDIHWSKGMHEAWNQIILDSRVTVSIDLFHFGILFFKKDQEKEHFTIYH